MHISLREVREKRERLEIQSQVERIVKLARESEITTGQLPDFLLLYITDKAYLRSAICQAEKIIREHLQKITEMTA